jgi:2-dehydropantoate 2-reductase
MDEVHALARARAANVAADYVDQLMQLSTSIPPDTKASQFNDLEAGNRLELDWLAGKVVALGREFGIPTPANEAIYAVLKLYKDGRRG